MKKVKKYLTGLLALILAISPLSPLVSSATGDSAPDINLVESLGNGGFEESVVGGAVTGWSLVTTNSAGSYDTSRDFTGNYLLSITNDAYAGEKALALSGKKGTQGYVVAQSECIKVIPGANYSFSYALKIQNVEAGQLYGGKVLVYQFDANGNLLEKKQVSNDLKENINWTNFTSAITVKENAAYVRLGFYIGGVWQKNVGIQILIDQISFVQSEITEDPDEEENGEEKPEVVKVDALINGGFEESVFNRPVSGWTLTTTNTAGSYDDSRDFTANYQLSVTDDAFVGEKAMALSGTKGTQGYVVAQSDCIKVTSGVDYSFGYAMKIQNVEAEQFYGGKVFIYQFDANGNLLEKKQVGKDYREDMDWTSFTASITAKEGADYVRLGFYIGGVWQKNSGVKILIDQVVFESITDEKLINGGFEMGSGENDVYSWHLTSKDSGNKPTTNNWAKNYSLKRVEKGYNGAAVAVTRNGMGYVSLDSNYIKSAPGITYMVDYAFKVENSVFETFFGVRAEVAEFDAQKNLISVTKLHTTVRENTGWTEMSNTIATGEKTAYIQIQVWVGGVKDANFTVTVDDVRVTKIMRSLSDDGIHNGGFEERLDGTVFDWSYEERLDSYFEPTFQGYNGTKGVKWVKPGTEGHGYATMKSNQFSVKAGKDYKLNYMARYGQQKGNVYIVAQLIVYNEKGEVLERLRNKEFDHKTKSTEWEQAVSYFTIPAGGVEARLEFLFCGTAYECWVDDFVWSLRDDDADVYGFDATDKDGNLAGWTVSQPISAKVDNTIYHNGNASLFVSQTLNVSTCKITSDVLIPLEQETRYTFRIYVKSFDCDIDANGMRLNALCYDKDGNYIKKIEGIHTTLNAGSQPSNWRELICGVNTGIDVAYVRMQLIVAAGEMHFWVDDLKWQKFDGNEFIEEFESVRDDGTPDGWQALIENGEPGFKTENGTVSISAEKSGDVGVLSGKWNTAQEYTTFQVDTAYKTTPGTEAILTIKYFDIFDKEIESQRLEKTLPATGGEWSTYSFKMVFISAKYAKIEIKNFNTGTVTVDAIYVTETEAEKSETEQLTSWRGQWIWHFEDHYKCTYSTRYFRYHLNLPSTPDAGSLQITADDKIKIWINGVEVTVDGAEDWATVGVLDGLEQYLVAGDNVFAISVYNGTSAAALLFDGYVETTDGQWIDFYSTDDVVSVVEAPDGWNKKDFDDSSWGKTRLLGPVGTSPWSDLEFDASAFVSDVVQVVDYEVTKELEAGNEATLTMTLIPEEDFDKDIELKGRLWVRNTLQNVYGITLKQVDGPPSSQWKAGQAVTVSYTFFIPDFLAEARYIVQMNVNQIKLVSPEIMNNKLVKATRVTNESAKNVTTEAKMVQVNGGSAIEINGELYPMMWYVIPSYQSYWSKTADQYMHDAGVCITRTWIKPGGEGEWPIWLDDGVYDFSVVDAAIYEILANHEDTYIMISNQLDVPTWWEEKYPEEMVVTSNGSDAGGVSYASDKFVEDATAVNLAMLEHMMQQPYANRIIGSTLTSCRTAEWLWYGSGQYATDMSEVNQKKFRQWLTETYQTDAALQEAWNNSTVTLETATVPTFEERAGETYATFVDPETQRNTIDYLTYMQDLVADRLIDFAATITEAVDDRWVIGTYFGYMNNVYYYNAPTTLHLGVEKVLADPNIDYFAAPTLYGERYDGESGSFMPMINSIKAHGKTFMEENDTRTATYHDYSSNFYTRDSVGPTYTVSDTLSQLQRDFAKELTYNVNQWYYNMWGSWFEHQMFSDQIEVFLNEKYVNMSRNSQYQAEVCYIIDEDMYENLAFTGFSEGYDVLYWLLMQQRYEMAQMGIPVDMYYMSDLKNGYVPDYKVYIMLAPEEIDDAEKQAIDKNLKNGNKTVVWQYICGASDGKTLSAENMSDIIGMDVVLDATPRNTSATFSKNDHWLIKGAEGKFYGTNNGQKYVSPVATITDKEATVLAYMNDKPSQAAFAIKDMGEWTSIYSAVPCIPTEVLVNVLEHAGVHRYCEDPGVVVFASDNYVAVNTAYGGEKTIKLNGTYAVYDVYGATTYSLSTDTITVNMEDNDTMLFRLMPENSLSVYVLAGQNGTSQEEGYTEYAPGETTTVKLQANDGYLLSAVVINGERTEVSCKEYAIVLQDMDNNYFIKAEYQTELKQSQQSQSSPAGGETGNWVIWVVVTAVFVLVLGAMFVLVIFAKNKKNKKLAESAQKTEEIDE